MSEARKPSPLGRYDDTDVDDTMHEVQLLGVPVRVLVAGRQHHEELMHEFSMLAVADESKNGVPQRMLELIETLGTQYAGTSERPRAEVDDAVDRGEDTVDLTYHVSAHVVDAAARLARLMAEADGFCEQEQMLTLQRSDTQIRFANWYLDEFRRQIAGEPPQPWDGPLDD